MDQPRLDAFLLAVVELEGTPYIWGGKTADGLDCSGLITYTMHALGGPDLRQSHNSRRMWAEWAPAPGPGPGVAAFYGPKDTPTHVVVCLPGGGIIGANGGSRRCTTVEIAKASRACVKRKHSPAYRPDLLGYRWIPWVTE